MLDIKKIKQKSNSDFMNHFPMIMLCSIIFLFLVGISYATITIPVIGSFIFIVIVSMLETGFTKSMLYIARYNQSPNAFTIFSIFPCFGAVFALAFVFNLYVGLWTLLFIIPGIIAYYNYYFIYEIYNDNPNMSVGEILKFSKGMTEGHKMNVFFYIDFSIGLPYILLIMFAMYLDVQRIVAQFYYFNFLDLIYLISDPTSLLGMNIFPTITIIVLVGGSVLIQPLYSLMRSNYYLELSAVLINTGEYYKNSMNKGQQQLNPMNGYQQQNPMNGYQQQNPMNGYQQQNPMNGYQQQNPMNGYQQQNPMNGYQQQNPMSGYQQQNPMNGYQQQNPMSGYQQQNPMNGYQQQNPMSGYQQQNPMNGYQQQNPMNGYQQQNPMNGYQQQNPMNGYQQQNPMNGYQQQNPMNGYQQQNPMNGYQQQNPANGYQQSDNNYLLQKPYINNENEIIIDK